MPVFTTRGAQSNGMRPRSWRGTCGQHSPALSPLGHGLPIPPLMILLKKRRNWWIFSWLIWFNLWCMCFFPFLQSKNQVHRRGEYNVYSTFQSHEPEFDYLKSLEIEEKINKIRWLPQQNAAYFLLSTNGRWRWLTSFGVFRDIVSKPCILISLSRHFPFYLAGCWKT